MFKLIYGLGLCVLFAIRVYYRWRYRGNQVVVSRTTAGEKVLLVLAFIGILVFPITGLITPWLDVVAYELPVWAGWIGAILLVLALWVLWRSHADLGRNWSQMLEVKVGQQLVTSGVYTHIRHPMYAALWLWALAQPFLLQNWIAGWSNLVSFGLLYAVRVPREERMLLDQFGSAYQRYMQATGRVIPHVGINLRQTADD